MATKKAAAKKKAPAKKKSSQEGSRQEEGGSQERQLLSRRLPALKEKMTKSQIVASLAESTGLSKKQVNAVMDESEYTDRAQHQEAFSR